MIVLERKVMFPTQANPAVLLALGESREVSTHSRLGNAAQGGLVP